MREILFRGKRVDNGEWVEGNLIHRTKYYGDDTDDYFILEGGEFDCDYYFDHAVIPETVSQYTGLTDKNSKRIFEGDIVKSSSLYGHCLGIIKYVACEFRCFTKEYGMIQMFDTEVIGNIFDNPELLDKSRE